MALLEALKESRRFAKMRLGQEAPEYATLPERPDIRFAIVPLTEAEYQRCLDAASSIEVGDNVYGVAARDRVAELQTLVYALREPDNPDKRVFESIEQLLDEEYGIEPPEINYLSEQYRMAVEFSSPVLDDLTDEQIDALKKAFVTIDWRGLRGRSLWHLTNLFMTLPVGVPLDNSSSLSSILKSIGTSESSESTPGASQS